MSDGEDILEKIIEKLKNCSNTAAARILDSMRMYHCNECGEDSIFAKHGLCPDCEDYLIEKGLEENL